MDRVLPGTIVVLAIALVLTIMALAWRSRRRRQRGLEIASPVPPELGDVLYAAPVGYVATTPTGSPLDRIAVAGLGFRARARLTVARAGIVLDLDGEPARFIPAAEVRGAGRATWAIDRVVEADGLAVIGWRLGDQDVESYLRTESDHSTRSLIGAIAAIAPMTVTKESEV